MTERELWYRLKTEEVFRSLREVHLALQVTGGLHGAAAWHSARLAAA